MFMRIWSFLSGHHCNSALNIKIDYSNLHLVLAIIPCLEIDSSNLHLALTIFMYIIAFLDCMDTISYCSHYKKKNYCTDRFVDYMKRNCPKTCGFCTPGLSSQAYHLFCFLNEILPCLVPILVITICVFI